MHYPVLISPSRVPELHAITANPDGSVFIGGAVSLSAVEHALSELDGIGKDVEGTGGRRAVGAGVGAAGAARACVDMLRWFASTQIRNVACLAGTPAVTFVALVVGYVDFVGFGGGGGGARIIIIICLPYFCSIFGMLLVSVWLILYSRTPSWTLGVVLLPRSFRLFWSMHA